MNISEIQEQWPFLSIMHPAHLEYIKKLPLNTLKYFIVTLHQLEPKKRHEIVQIAAYMLFVPFVDQEDRMSFLNDEENLFTKFGVKCLETINVFNEALFVMAMVQYILYVLSNMGDTTNVDTVKSRLVKLADFIQRENEKENQLESEAFVDKLVDDATNLEEKTKENYLLYTYFCENIVQQLLEQKIS